MLSACCVHTDEHQSRGKGTEPSVLHKDQFRQERREVCFQGIHPDFALVKQCGEICSFRF